MQLPRGPGIGRKLVSWPSGEDSSPCERGRIWACRSVSDRSGVGVGSLRGGNAFLPVGSGGLLTGHGSVG